MANRGNLTWLWVMIAAAVLTQTALNLLRPVTSYKLLALGAGEATVGLATAAYAILPLVFAMSLGRLSSRLPTLRGMIALGALVLGLGGVGLAFGSTIAVLMVSSAVLGMGHLLFTIAGQTVIGRRAAPENMDAAFGWFTAAFSVGQMSGPLISGLILGNATLGEASHSAEFDGRIDGALWLGAVCSLLAVPVMYLMRADGGRRSRRLPAEPTEEPGDRPHGLGDGNSGPAGPASATETALGAGAAGAAGPGKPTMLAIWRVPGIPSHMMASLALLAMLDILTAFMPLVGEAAGVSPFWVGILLAVRGGASFLSRIVLPWMSGRWERHHLVLVSLLASAVALGFVPPALEGWHAVWLAVVLMAVGGFALGIGQPLTMSLVSQAVPPTWRGPALAFRLVGNRVGQVAMPVVAGLAAAPLGPAGGIWCACLILAASGTERLVSGRKR
ncbi:MFS transporter [Citricoccus alkalitolerans]|uniref:MFS transporter n=1 Tax=Citricoccus alkalitolerans TaxID=246603 RepID=A0ABV8XVR4_9MICC